MDDEEVVAELSASNGGSTSSRIREPQTAVKRKWAEFCEDGTAQSDVIIQSDDDLESVVEDAGFDPLCAIMVPEPKYPKSLYVGHEPPVAVADENSILQDLLRDTLSDPDQTGDTFLEADLSDFCVYRAFRSRRAAKSATLSEKTASYQFASLNELNDFDVECFFFDGTLSFEGKHHYLEKIPFQLLSLGGYEDLTRVSVGSDIWIQSFQGQKADVWYRLGRPAVEYRRYHQYFLWAADLAKHVIDFIFANERIHLADFRQAFTNWLLKLYRNKNILNKWLDDYGDRDFRRVISRQAVFLYSQAVQMGRPYYRCPLWAEVHPRDLTRINQQLEDGKPQPDALFPDSTSPGGYRRKTTVTPYVFECFRHLPWAPLLHSQSPWTPRSEVLANVLAKPKRDLKPTETEIHVGDVVAIAPESNSPWKTNCAEWLALVQGMESRPSGNALSVLWMYRPDDTACMKMRYPHINEVFLSDHCNCGDANIFASHVIRLPKVAFFNGPDDSDTEFFCRQYYREADAAWTTLQPHHFRCPCKIERQTRSYHPEQTVLYRCRSILRPAIIVGPDLEDQGKLQIRRLLFRGRDFGDAEAAPNELVFTERMHSINPERITRPCDVRAFPACDVRGSDIPFPCNRDGTGDFFYIRCRETLEGGLQDLETTWTIPFLQGKESMVPSDRQPLRALDLFCGGGNFARGLEDSGAIKCEWAVDYFKEAIHTYRANTSKHDHTRYFFGSVNHFLSEALRGQTRNGLIPKVGQVEIIIAGSPCQGFSMANPKKGNIPGLMNESLVASVVSFIDFYRPKYALLENVKGMAMGGEDKNVLAAVLCAVVSMGYQVQTHLLDAWSFGSPQSRSRIFVVCTAPGLPVPAEPLPTHSHPPWVKSAGLGRTANGLQTSVRHDTPTAFSYVTAEIATRDLPPCDSTIASIRYPDHREARPLSILDRIRIAAIPRYPEGLGFLDACRLEMMPQPQIDRFGWNNQTRSGANSKVWTRIKRHKLFPTIQTYPRPDDGHGGIIVHWHEHRLLTILEARRAQGFLDQDVILGSPADQWKIIGNSVARPVAFALGLTLREAWLAMDRGTTTETDHSTEIALSRDGSNSTDAALEGTSTPQSVDDVHGDRGQQRLPLRNTLTALNNALTEKALDLMGQRHCRRPSF